VPSFALERELLVLAGDAAFAILSGTAEFTVTDDALTVLVLEGEIVADLGSGPTVLAAGQWRADRGRAGDREWASIELAVVEAPTLDIEGEELTEREWYRPTGTLPKRVVRDAMNRTKPELKKCYETALKRFPELDVSITARVRVGGGGDVSWVKLRGAERWPELEVCLSSVLGQMSFPPPHGGSVDLILPLRLSPEQ
jgi:hypothetical protein